LLLHKTLADKRAAQTSPLQGTCLWYERMFRSQHAYCTRRPVARSVAGLDGARRRSGVPARPDADQWVQRRVHGRSEERRAPHVLGLPPRRESHVPQRRCQHGREQDERLHLLALAGILDAERSVATTGNKRGNILLFAPWNNSDIALLTWVRERLRCLSYPTSLCIALSVTK